MLLKYFLLSLYTFFWRKIISIDDLCMRPLLCRICMRLKGKFLLFNGLSEENQSRTHIFPLNFLIVSLNVFFLLSLAAGKCLHRGRGRNSNSSAAQHNNNKIAVCVSVLCCLLVSCGKLLLPDNCLYKNVITMFQYVHGANKVYIEECSLSVWICRLAAAEEQQ